jgi:hypothetical protein
MALLFVGHSECGICKQTIESAGEAAGFGAFVLNESDPLYRFSDGVFHQRCLEADVLGRRCLEVADRFDERCGPAVRRCAVCGEAMLDHRDAFGFGVLSSDPASRLYELNFLMLHCSHVSDWSGVAEALALLRGALSDGELSGRGVEVRVEELESLAS